MTGSEDAPLQSEADHQPAFIFGSQDADGRPSKRRATEKSRQNTGLFAPLLDGRESAECVALREELFTKAWSAVEARIQHVLREVNAKTLQEVGAFVGAEVPHDKIPAAFVITGPNITSQELLFEQLAESLASSSPARIVRLRSAEAPNLKAALKKIIRDATGDEDARRHLDYDLEALRGSADEVVVAFQDTEAFDGALLSDLLLLFSSFRNRIRFTLLFGIATSVELLQARLLRSAAQLVHGAQFDVVQANTVLESVFKAAVAHHDAVLRLGPGLLSALVERQREQVAGIQVFVSSVKYAYMCHFYANPLCALLETADHDAHQLTAIRTLGSFRSRVERAVDERRLKDAASLLDDDEFLSREVVGTARRRDEYSTRLLRSLHLLLASGIPGGSFTDLYVAALSEGIDLGSGDASFLDSVRRFSSDDVSAVIRRLLRAVTDGAPDLGVAGWAAEEGDGGGAQLAAQLAELLRQADELAGVAREKGVTLRSRHSAQSRVVRTTVVAQRVQLSRDAAELTREDAAFTDIVERLAALLGASVACEPADAVFLHELWLYDVRSPYRDVFVPRPGATVERALSRPHDYLACSCCGGSKTPGQSASPTLPATAILYHLYLETGSLINVADLWAAFYARVGEKDEGGLGEREALARFYQALAEMKAMGFVKASRKKADHIAKVKWL